MITELTEAIGLCNQLAAAAKLRSERNTAQRNLHREYARDLEAIAERLRPLLPITDQMMVDLEQAKDNAMLAFQDAHTYLQRRVRRYRLAWLSARRRAKKYGAELHSTRSALHRAITAKNF